MNRKIVGAAVLACALGATASARAQALPVDGVRVVVPNQTTIEFLEFSDATTAPESFIGSTGLPVGFDAATIFLTEIDSDELSDALTIIQNTTGGIDVFFFSDPLTLPLANVAPRQFTIKETGQWQDVSSFFGQPTGFAQVISDVDTSQHNFVPEPASWTMMLVGFGGLGAVLRARRQASMATT